MISQMSKKQNFVALSTSKENHITISMARCEAVWLRKIVGEQFEKVLDNTMIYFDNKSGIRLVENLVFQDNSKHTRIKQHYIRDMMQRGVVRLHHISPNEHITYILTKALPKRKLLVFRE